MSNSKEFVPEDFLTRAERVKQLMMPDTTEYAVIVKPNTQALGFRNNCYDSSILGEHIDKLTFNNTVKKANKICENVWRAKKVEEDAEYSKNYRRVLYIAIFISVISFALLLILIYGSGGNVLLYVSLVMICIAAILTLFVVIKSLFSQPNFIDLEESIIKGMRILLEDENEKIYKGKNLEWKMQEKCYWIELHLLGNVASKIKRKERELVAQRENMDSSEKSE